MTVRRVRLVTTVVVAVAALSMGPALAAGTARITTPATGATLTSPTSITIEVIGDNGTNFQPRDHEVQVRLADHTGVSAYAGTRTVAATCRTDCHTDSTWTVASFDPATLAPFAAGPSCNGSYTVQAQVDGGAWAGNAIRIARAPGAPRNVSVTGGVREATIQWGAAPDPDVVGYTVDRRRDGAWQQVAGVAPGIRSVTDDDVAAGEVEYRVVTLRGDGLTSGRPAAPCTDDDPDLATPSAPVATTVRSVTSAPTSPSPSPGDGPRDPSPSDSPSADGGTDGSGTDGSGTDGSGDGDGPDGGTDGGTSDGDGEGDDGTMAPGDGDPSGDDGDDGDGTADDQDGTATPSRDAGSRVAPPSRVDTMNAPDVDVPSTSGADGPQVATEEERFYGEGQGYSEELDFGDIEDTDDLGEVDALGEGPATTRAMRVPGALQAVLGEELALDRVLAPVAAGMILLAFGLHLRRWTREGLEQG